MHGVDMNMVGMIFSTVARIAALSIIAFYIIPKQIIEVLRPYDWLTRLRWQILLLFIFTLLSAIPAIYYQLLDTVGHTNNLLQSISYVLSSLGSLGTSILLVLIYNYRKKD